MSLIRKIKCPDCSAPMSGITSRQQIERAKLMMRLCTNPKCAKVLGEVLPSKGAKPNESLSGRLRSEAQKMAGQLRRGELGFRNGYWYPVRKVAESSATSLVGKMRRAVTLVDAGDEPDAGVPVLHETVEDHLNGHHPHLRDDVNTKPTISFDYED